VAPPEAGTRLGRDAEGKTMGWLKDHRALWLVPAGVAIAALVASDIHQFVTRDKGLEYYASAPFLLLIPIGIGTSAGSVLWLFPWLRQHGRRKAILWGWGIGNAAATFLVAMFCYRLAPLVWYLGLRLKEVGVSKLPAALAFLVLVVAVLVVALAISWRYFLRAVRSGWWSGLTEGTPGPAR
jgi:hypothetical protein